MAETSLVFNILAKDKASGTFNKVKAGAALLGAAIATMAIKFGKDGVAAASDMNESLSKTNVVFGKSAAEVLKWSESSAKSFGLSRQASLEASATIGNLLLSMGKTPQAASKMSTGIVQLSADMASFNNVPTEEVLKAIQSGLTGEIAPLRRFGVNLTDATLKAKALSLGLYDGTGALDVSAKSTAAYQLILEQTKTAQGDFARTSDGLANQQKILSATYQDVAAKAGKALLPALIAVAGAIMSTTAFIGDHSTAFKIAAVATLALASGIGGLIVAGKIHALTLAMQTQGTFAYAAAQKAAAVWAGIVTAAQWAWNAALTANPIGLVIAAIALLVGGLILAYNRSETFRNIVDGAFRGVAAAGRFMWDTLKSAFGFLANAWLTVAGVILDAAVKAFGWIGPIGDKLRGAQKEFYAFKDSVNAALAQVVDKEVTITARVVQIGQGTLANKRIPLFAGGVQNFGGGLAMVGEQGPELVTLPAGSSVYSAPETRQMMGSPAALGGGGTTVINLSVSAIDGPGAESAVKRLLEGYVSRNGKLRGLTV